MRKNILVYMRDDEIIDKLKNDHHVTSFLSKSSIHTLDFQEALKNADGIINLMLPIDTEMLDQAPNVKIISNVSVGYDHLPIAELTKRDIMATNTPNVLDNTTADAVFAIILATARRVTELDHFVKSGQWNQTLQPAQYGVDVHHKTLGIIGMGNIGRAIARRAHHGFGMKILYHNRTRQIEAEKEYNATYCTMEELLQSSDFVCLMVPASEETKHMIGQDQFKKMKKSAIFINGSRGQNVDEKALYEALIHEEIYAAGIDVFEQEPTDPNNPLLTLPNIVTLPHIGSSTAECELNMTKLAVENLLSGLFGEKPKNLINQEVWKN